MNSSRPTAQDFTIGIVGDGFGALLTYVTAVYLGFRPEQIGIFGQNTDPVQTYLGFATNLGQTVLRSESESHFLPADWPTFAEMDAFARLDPAPLMRSVGRKFNPGVPEIMAEARLVSERLGFPQRLVGHTKVGWLTREGGPPAHYVMWDEDANFLGRAKHVMIALGHGPLTYPGAYGKAKEDPEIGDRIVQAYEPKTYYPGGRYVVLGSGIAAVNEWVNVVEAGASCIALRRNPEPDEQDLNVPRCLFDGSGIDAFSGLSFDERVDFLGQVLKGTAPQRRNWAGKIKQARAEGRYEEIIGQATDVRAGPAGLAIDLDLKPSGQVTLDVTGVTCGTGFVKSVLALPLLRRMAQLYDIPVEHERIVLKTNCGVPPLDREDSRLSLMGLSANTIVPNGDTIAGLKFIARRFVGDCARAEDIRYRSFPSRLGMQLSLARGTVKELRRVQKTEQLA